MTPRMTKPIPTLPMKKRKSKFGRTSTLSPLVYTQIDIPHLGSLRLLAQGKWLCAVQGGTQIQEPMGVDAQPVDVQAHPVLAQTHRQLLAYALGQQRQFDLPLMPDLGSDFDRKIWRALGRIPYGQTTTYKALGEQVGHPKAYRAVGVAVGRNPWLIVLPCHRVLGYNGRLVGFAAGLSFKEQLLDMELRD